MINIYIYIITYIYTVIVVLATKKDKIRKI